MVGGALRRLATSPIAREGARFGCEGPEGPLPHPAVRRAREPITTVAYTHTSDEELYSEIRGIWWVDGG
jgi:hypothetical protein